LIIYFIKNIKNYLKIRYIIKIYYIINYNLVKIINNFDFFNKMSGDSCKKKSNIKYLEIKGDIINYNLV
jgi:hypothetical protein